MDLSDVIRQRVDRARRDVRRAVAAAADAAESSGASEHNIASAINVGRPGAVTGVSVRQRTRVRPDGTRVTETTRTVLGDGPTATGSNATRRT